MCIVTKFVEQIYICLKTFYLNLECCGYINKIYIKLLDLC